MSIWALWKLFLADKIWPKMVKSQFEFAAKLSMNTGPTTPVAYTRGYSSFDEFCKAELPPKKRRNLEAKCRKVSFTKAGSWRFWDIAQIVRLTYEHVHHYQWDRGIYNFLTCFATYVMMIFCSPTASALVLRDERGIVRAVATYVVGSSVTMPGTTCLIAQMAVQKPRDGFWHPLLAGMIEESVRRNCDFATLANNLHHEKHRNFGTQTLQEVLLRIGCTQRADPDQDPYEWSVIQWVDDFIMNTILKDDQETRPAYNSFRENNEIDTANTSSCNRPDMVLGA
jgi:hypothetical protein